MAYFETEDFLVPFCKIDNMRFQKDKIHISTIDFNFELPRNTSLNAYKEWLNEQR